MVLKRPRTEDEKRKIGFSRKNREIAYLEFDKEHEDLTSKSGASLKALCSVKGLV